MQITAKFAGSLPEGFTVEVPSGLSISMTGRKSLMDRIARGEVTVDLDALPVSDPETLANTYDLVLPVRFYDSSNVLLDGIVSSIGEEFTANVRVVVRAYKEVEIEPSIEMLEEGYTWSYVLSRSKVLLYGSRSDLSKIDKILTETITATPNMNNTPMAANLIIPDGVELAAGTGKSVTVTLLVEETNDRQTVEIPLTYLNVRYGTALAEDVPKTVTIEVSGPISKLKLFQTGWVKATVDCNGYEAGTVTLPVQISIDNRASALTVDLKTETVDVTLIDKNAEE